MPSTTDLMEMPGLFALLKGESGIGKSTAAMSFPNILVQDFDRKMPSIAIKHYPGKKIDWETYEDIFAVDKRLRELDDYCPYETIIGDSITALANLTISSVDQIKNKRAPDFLRVLNADKTVSAMTMDNYGAEDRFITHYIQTLKKLHQKTGNPKHVILIAHVVTVEQGPNPFKPNQPVVKTRSIVSKGRKVAAWVPTEFDNVYTFGVEGPEMGAEDRRHRRICLTEAYEDDMSKCSFPFPAKFDFTDVTLYDQMNTIVKWDSEVKLIETTQNSTI